MNALSTASANPSTPTAISTTTPTINTKSLSALWKKTTQARCPIRYTRKFAAFVAGNTRRKMLFRFMLIRSLHLTFQTERDRACYVQRELVLFENAADVVRALLPESEPEPLPEPVQPTPVQPVDWDEHFSTHTEPGDEVLRFIEQYPNLESLEGATFADLARFVEGGTPCLN